MTAGTRMLDSLLRELESETTRVTVYRRESDPPIDDIFPNRNVDITYKALPPAGPDPFVVVERNSEFVGVLGLSELEALVEPPIVRSQDDDGVSEAYRVFFDVLDDTVFTAMDRTTLLAVSREIEDRAYRVGTGTLRVSFQRFSAFQSQIAVYRSLAADTSLDIHIHGVADWDPPAIDGITYHDSDAGSLGRYWALTFDGGGDPMQASGLLAEERDDGYTGFWSDDAGIVANIERGLVEHV
ncbi:DICT sensory domain-containing protein [Halobaculum limi]|uniref:DICT sensory domain-containing protein n=1 Tax=Halobaculum limi TaxID=3031916 RepID=UPI00240649AD|nr:DICT sensory domain-containing protein [Halobaculum sp. YSMS11]